MNIFCPYCRAQVDDSWAFCPKCGKDLGSVRAMQTEEPKPVVSETPPLADFGLGMSDLSSFDLLADMADSCLAQDLARQEAEALAAFEVEKHQNGKYAILSLKDKSEMTVVVPDGVEAIGPNAFEGSDVMTVTLPEGLLKIGDRAFANCADLDSINFPRSLRVIGDEAFAGCANLDVEPPERVRLGVDLFKGTAQERRLEEAERARQAEEERARREAQDALEQDAEYCYQQAYNYDFGKNGVERNGAEAVRLYRKAAEFGHARAQYSIGFKYYYGEYGLKKDHTETVKWLVKAVEQGYQEAEFMLGNLYYTGDGVEQDKDEAVRLVRKAAEQGNRRAQKDLYDWYKDGAKIDRAEAINWLQKAAEQGSNSARCDLGKLYYEGKDVERDLDKAEYWLSEAVKGNAYGAERDLEKVKKLKRIR